MKKLLLSAWLMLAAVLAHAGANDVQLTQRNPTDTGIAQRLLPTPADGKDRIFYFNGTTLLPGYLQLGAGLTSSSGVLNAVPADWAAASGQPGFIQNKPTISTAGMTGQYGDLVGVPVSFAPAPHTQAWSTITATPTTLAGYGITDAVTGAALSTALASYPTSAQVTAQLGGYATTSALTAGLATKFNDPTGTAAQYLRGDGSLATFPALTSGTVTSVTAGAGLAGGTITGAGTISLPNTGAPGTYSGVTTDAQGRVTGGTVRSFSLRTPTLNTCFQVSATRDAHVNYAVDVSTTLTLAGGARGSVYLRAYTDSACTASQQTLISGSSGLPAALSVAVGLQNLGSVALPAIVPGGAWVRIETANDTGTPTFTARPGQEVLL